MDRIALILSKGIVFDVGSNFTQNVKRLEISPFIA